MCKLDVNIFMDINAYNDSLQVRTEAIVNPYESYCKLPMDNQTLCFLNIYFDLYEIGRRELEAALYARKENLLMADAIYKRHVMQMEEVSDNYLRAVLYGTNEKALMQYNNMVYEKLGINNLELFPPGLE